MLEGTQQDAAPRVEARAAGEVRTADDEVDDGAHFGLRRRIRSGAELLEFLPPTRREIPIQVKALLWFPDAQRKAIVMLEPAFGHQPIIGPAGFRGIAANQQTRLIGMRLPQPAGLGGPPLQYAS